MRSITFPRIQNRFRPPVNAAVNTAIEKLTKPYLSCGPLNLLWRAHLMFAAMLSGSTPTVCGTQATTLRRPPKTTFSIGMHRE